MRENKLSITINRSVEDVFRFSIDPQNTPSWYSGIVEEQVSARPIQKGIVYKNRRADGAWSEYVVSAFCENELFELTSRDGRCMVRYNYKPVSADQTVMIYHEWMTEGDLAEPCGMDTMERLKKVLEI